MREVITPQAWIYIVNPAWSGRRISNELVANHLYSPSLNNPGELDIWSNDYFLQLVDSMKIQ